MRRVRTGRSALALLLVAALVLGAAGCASGDAAVSGDSAFASQSVTVDRVEITAAPLQVDTDQLLFRLTLDTHTTPLDLDVAAVAVLRVGGVEQPAGSWEGDGPGGHHREGTLRFAGVETPGPLELQLGGFRDLVAFRWDPEHRR